MISHRVQRRLLESLRGLRDRLRLLSFFFELSLRLRSCPFSRSLLPGLARLLLLDLALCVRPLSRSRSRSLSRSFSLSLSRLPSRLPSRSSCRVEEGRDDARSLSRLASRLRSRARVRSLLRSLLRSELRSRLTGRLVSRTPLSTAPAAAAACSAFSARSASTVSCARFRRTWSAMACLERPPFSSSSSLNIITASSTLRIRSWCACSAAPDRCTPLRLSGGGPTAGEGRLGSGGSADGDRCRPLSSASSSSRAVPGCRPLAVTVTLAVGVVAAETPPKMSSEPDGESGMMAERGMPPPAAASSSSISVHLETGSSGRGFGAGCSAGFGPGAGPTAGPAAAEVAPVSPPASEEPPPAAAAAALAAARASLKSAGERKVGPMRGAAASWSPLMYACSSASRPT
mmetsp:Transcript_16329/g.48954  ORF Transcript_16329/g.48954 Transcript_16329/m.48954 type:complete len:402 (-) Transcript_16329:2116-3321(-)